MPYQAKGKGVGRVRAKSSADGAIENTRRHRPGTTRNNN